MDRCDQNCSTDEYEEICAAFSRLDTGHKSLIHLLLAPPPGSENNWRNKYLCVYCSIIIIFYFFPAAVAVFSRLPLFEVSAAVKVPFFQDYNLMCMTMLTLPCMVLFLLSERRFIPKALVSVINSGIVRPDPTLAKQMIARATGYYQRWNVVGQILGATVGIIVAACNYHVLTQPNFGAHLAINEALTPTGWIYVVLHMPIFYGTVSIYILRAIITTYTLFIFVKISSINVDPFHQDASGGLHKVGVIGLRNQYLLAMAGVNVLCLFIVIRALGYPQGMVIFLVECVIVILLAGPLVFIGPLLPFRKSMLIAKRQQTEKISLVLARQYHKMVDSLPNDENIGKDHEKIQQLRELQGLAKRIPVWPLDVGTMEKFVTAYFLPIATAIITFSIERLIRWINSL